MITNINKPWLMLIFYAIFITITTAPATPLPDLGNETYSLISPQAEKLLGLTWLHQLRKAKLIAKNPAINAYLTKIGNELLANTQQQDLNKFNFFLIDKPEINAFAFLGGNVGIFAGLITATATESELAAVLAHEISHVTQKHFVRQLFQHKKMIPITMAGSLAMAAVGLPDLIFPIMFGGHMQQMLAFSRSQEQEADHIGIQILARTKFDPHAMGDLFNRFNDLEKRQETPIYLLTHPMFTTRITEAYNRTAKVSYKQYLDSEEYKFIKAKLEVEFHSDPRFLYQQLTAKLADQQALTPEILKFQIAVIYQSLYKHANAIQIMKKLIKQYPNNLFLQGFDLELILPIDPQLANEKAAALCKAFPGHLPLSLLYAKALLQLSRPLQAIEVLQAYDQEDPYELLEEPELYALLISGYQQTSQLAEKLLAQAKLLFLQQELELAEQKLQQALNHIAKSKKFINSAKINNFLIRLKKFHKDLEKINI